MRNLISNPRLVHARQASHMCPTVTRTCQILWGVGAGHRHIAHLHISVSGHKPLIAMKKQPTAEGGDSITVSSCTSSSCASIGNCSPGDASTIFRNPPERNRHDRASAQLSSNPDADDGVSKLSPPPVLELRPSEESIIDESFDLNPILLKVRSIPSSIHRKTEH